MSITSTDVHELIAESTLDSDAAMIDAITRRSEEHTSELQSLAYLVCRLLLEKKKKKPNTAPTSRATISAFACRQSSVREDETSRQRPMCLFAPMQASLVTSATSRSFVLLLRS